MFILNLFYITTVFNMQNNVYSKIEIIQHDYKWSLLFWLIWAIHTSESLGYKEQYS
jgi:hypothetical protein